MEQFNWILVLTIWNLIGNDPLDVLVQAENNRLQIKLDHSFLDHVHTSPFYSCWTKPCSVCPPWWGLLRLAWITRLWSSWKRWSRTTCRWTLVQIITFGNPMHTKSWQTYYLPLNSCFCSWRRSWQFVAGFTQSVALKLRSCVKDT